MCNIVEPYPREIDSCELCGVFDHISFLGTVAVCDNCLDLFLQQEQSKARDDNDTNHKEV